MFENLSTRLHTLEIGTWSETDRVDGWRFVRSVEVWLTMLRRFQALVAEALDALAGGDYPERDAVAARFARTMSDVEDAMPTLTFDADVRAAIKREASSADAAGERALHVRLEQLDKEVEEVELWIVGRLGMVSNAAPGLQASA